VREPAQARPGTCGGLPGRVRLAPGGCGWFRRIRGEVSGATGVPRVITEDAVAGYDGAEPSAVGKSGPGRAVAEDVTEALTAGRFFRLVDRKSHELAIGRLYDPSGQNELAPLDDFGRQNLSAPNIEFRAEGDWQAA
jgi:hypothetical protein